MKIIVQNLATEYHDEGSGETILFLHGWGDSLHTFDAVVSFFLPGKRIVRLNLPGFGGTEPPSDVWGVSDYALFVSDFLKKLDLRADVVVGHSFGGRVIIRGLAEENFVARAVILIGAAGILHARDWRNRILKFFSKAFKLFLFIPPFVFWRDQLRKKIYRALGSDYAEAGEMQKIFLKVIAEDLSDDAKKITIPTLLIWGERDSITPLSDGEKLSRLISDSRLSVVSGADHFVHKEKPKEVAELIQEFL